MSYLIALAGLTGAFAAGYEIANTIWKRRFARLTKAAADAVYEGVMAGAAMAEHSEPQPPSPN